MSEENELDMSGEMICEIVDRLLGTVPRVKVDKYREFVCMHVAYEYEISLDSISDPLALLRWICHLSEKNWVDVKLLHEFIAVVCAEKNWELPKL